MSQPARRSSKPTVFISYSHKDEKWKDRLLAHLQVLEREGHLEVWDDRRIAAGAEWLPAIRSALENARVAVLLISTDFLNSNFIRNEEIPRLLQRREKEGVRVIPVIAHYCPWQTVTSVSQFQARPRDGKPLADLRGPGRDRALMEIALEIRTLLDADQGGKPPKEEIPPPSPAFLESYRARLGAKFSAWNLAFSGVVQAGGAGRAITATLDVMYLPLRLANGFDINFLSAGKLVKPNDLPQQRKPLAIRGSAGTGKTTWIRYTFRRLLEEKDALPLLLILRDELTRRWKDPACRGSERSLDAVLVAWMSQELGLPEVEAAEELRRLLGSSKGPRPVLLVDGWDEAGPLGHELREKLLGFMREYSRLQVVVTSRPYGDGRPSHAEGFEVLDIQPLADSEIELLARRFFRHCYGDEEKTAAASATELLAALSRAPEAKILARTALLLTMMLLISRSRPLPDKRHLLYEACIENLLTALPKRYEEQGVQLQAEQWRPDDGEERMRVVASLAAGVQEAGYKTKTRSTIFGTREELIKHFPGDWKPMERFGFLAWLAGPAGLLNERIDGTLSFTHLSFQEFLTAWHLNASVEGASERSEAFRIRLSESSWWETLRLWAALIERSNPGRLEPVLTSLQASRKLGLYLAGMVMADGVGSEIRFDSWLQAFIEALDSGEWSEPRERCAEAWAASRQLARKDKLFQALQRGARPKIWTGWMRLSEFSELSKLGRELLPAMDSVQRAIVGSFWGETSSALSVAGSRFLCGVVPLWPVEPQESGLLQVWPTHRRIVGLRLQLAAACGASQLQLAKLFSVAARLAVSTGNHSRDLAHSLARDLARFLGGSDAARFLVRDLSCDFSRYITRYLAGSLPPDRARDFAYDLAPARDLILDLGRTRDLTTLDFDRTRDLACYLSRGLVRYQVSRLAQGVARELARDLERDLAHELARKVASDRSRDFGFELNAEWFPSFFSYERFSLGRVGARAVLASVKRVKNPQVQLLAIGCQISLQPGADSAVLDKALRKHKRSLHPLWPALARHLARRREPGDWYLLDDLAQYPEKAPEPLSWGLQYIVRGDVVMLDGSKITLDQLADEAGIPRLPYLEELPDERDVW